MKIQAVLSVVLLSISLLAFQNCGEVSFGPNDNILLVEKSANSDLDEDFLDEVDSLGDLVVDHRDSSGDILSDGDDAVSDDRDSDLRPGHQGQAAGSNATNLPRGPTLALEDDLSGGDEGLVFQCILEGPGNSKRLGVIEDVLFKNGRTPQTVCMSRSACENIVSQKFKVKQAKRAGFCGKNPHTIQLLDQRVQELVDQI